jgi:urocanate hydratase
MVTMGGGAPELAERTTRVLWSDPVNGVMCHTDAGYHLGIGHSRGHGVELPSVVG